MTGSAEEPAAAALRLEDAALVARVRAGDEAALEALYQRYGAACFRLVRRILGDADLAQDAVQQVFLALWQTGPTADGQSRPGYDPSRGAVGTWLLSVAHHKAVDLLRREMGRRKRLASYQELTEIEAAGPGPADQAWVALRAERTRAALRELSPEHREVLLLAYYGGYSQSEISGMTGLPLGTVKSRTLHAMRHLRTRLAGDLSTSEGSER